MPHTRNDSAQWYHYPLALALALGLSVDTGCGDSDNSGARNVECVTYYNTSAVSWDTGDNTDDLNERAHWVADSFQVSLFQPGDIQGSDTDTTELDPYRNAVLVQRAQALFRDYCGD